MAPWLPHARGVRALSIVRLRGVLAWMPCLLLLLGVSSASRAASIAYGDFGPELPPGIVAYQDVREDSGTDPVPPGRFGAPTLGGNTLDFDPSGFTASGTGGAADVTDVQLNFDVSVLSSEGVVAGGITSILFTERGDYSLLGGGTAATQVAAGVAVSIDILAVDGAPIAPIHLFASSAILRDLVSDGPVVLAPWDHGVLVEFGPVLAAHAIDFEFGVTRAEVAIDDQLIAVSEAGSVAFVAKKDFRIDPGIVANPGFAVPEPSAALLALTALAGIAGARPRAS